MNAALMLTAALSLGQAGEHPQPPPPPRPGGVEARKEARDRALQSVGREALGFCKHYGNLGVQALLQCRPETGKRLVELHESGELSRLPNPRAALEAVRRHGEPVAAWVAERHAELCDPDALECFCREPGEFVYELKDLHREAEARRAQRGRHALPWAEASQWPPGTMNLVVSVAGVGAALLGWWAWKRRRA